MSANSVNPVGYPSAVLVQHWEEPKPAQPDGDRVLANQQCAPAK